MCTTVCRRSFRDIPKVFRPCTNTHSSGSRSLTPLQRLERERHHSETAVATANNATLPQRLRQLRRRAAPVPLAAASHTSKRCSRSADDGALSRAHERHGNYMRGGCAAPP